MYKIVANWKMYLDVQNSRNLAGHFVKWLEKNGCSELEFTICPSNVALWDVARQLEGSGALLGAQDIARSLQLGAFTAQTAGTQLKEAGCSEVIIGHSEVRQFLGDTDEIVAQKMQTALAHNLIPIVCIGETKEEKASGQTDAIVTQQLHTIFQDQTLNTEIIIAYEPRWAISSVSGGAVCSPEDAAHMHQLIEHTLHEFGNEEQVKKTKILYGGSVTSENIVSYLNEPRIDGTLIGGASAKQEKFQEIVRILLDTYCL